MSTRLPLKKGYVLKGYSLGEVLGGGGFSLVYLASQELSRKNFVIKEYCPQGLVTRNADGSISISSTMNQGAFNDGLQKFITEATALKELNHPNMVSVSDSFKANNTVYIVMAREEGKDLHWFITKLRDNLDFAFLKQVFQKIGHGLHRVHELGLVHLDVKPAKILLRKSGEPLLLDFGAAMAVDSEDRFSSFLTVTHGFAPPEQYLDDPLGPWTDIYGLGATMYNCITGRPPPPALRRKDGVALEPLTVKWAGKYPFELLKAVDAALALDPQERPQSVAALMTRSFEGPAES